MHVRFIDESQESIKEVDSNVSNARGSDVGPVEDDPLIVGIS